MKHKRLTQLECADQIAQRGLMLRVQNIYNRTHFQLKIRDTINCSSNRNSEQNVEGKIGHSCSASMIQHY